MPDVDSYYALREFYTKRDFRTAFGGFVEMSGLLQN